MPALQLDGSVHDYLWVSAVMLFPNDLSAAQKCFAVEQLKAMTDGDSDDEMRVVDTRTIRLILDAPSYADLGKQIVENTKRATVAGDLLAAIYIMDRFNVSRPSMNKAKFVAMEFAKKAQYGDGTPLNKSEPMVIKCWNEFHGVAHLWAASRLQLNYPYAHPGSQLSPEGISTFLQVAQGLFEFGVSYIPNGSKPGNPILDPKKCWCLPNTIQARHLKSDRQPDRLLKTLEKYKAPKSHV